VKKVLSFLHSGFDLVYDEKLGHTSYIIGITKKGKMLCLEKYIGQ
jgi:hypothetical protein